MLKGFRRISDSIPLLSLTILLIFVVFSPSKLSAQRVILLCNDPCSNPTPTPTPIPTPTPTSSPTPSPSPAPTPPPLAPGPRQNFLGTESFAYAVPLFDLPGRHGLDLKLALYYNSAYWTGPDSQGYVWPASNWDLNPGFRLGFGKLSVRSDPRGSAFIEPSGIIHPLKDTSGNGTAFVSTDSTYIHVQSDPATGNSVVTYKNGTQISFAGAVPVKIEDSSGNFIAINYSGNISSVVDTTGRTLNFIYGAAGATGALACITDGSTCGAAGSHTFTFTWVPYTLHFNFAKVLQQGATQNGISYLVVSSVTRPDGTKVQFNYGDWGIVNDIEEISSNGTVRYEASYDFPLASAGVLTAPPVYTDQTVTTIDANGIKQQAKTSYQEATATLAPGKNVVTCFAATDPAGTINMVSFSAAGNNFDGLPVQNIVATGSSAPCSSAPTTVLRSTSTQWTSDQDSSGNFTGINARRTSITTVLEDGLTQSQMQFAGYDANGNVTDAKQFDFGSGRPGPLLRETVITYAPNLGSILNLPADVQIKDGAGTVLSHQTFSYDDYTQTSLQAVTPLPGGFDNLNFDVGSTKARGNLTGSTVYANAEAGTGAVSSNFTYDILGNQLSAQSGCCTFRASVFSVTTQYAYPDSVSIGPSSNPLTTSVAYDMISGQATTVTDPNGQKTQLSYDGSVPNPVEK